MTEFHFACDPAAARQVLRRGAPLTLLPLDVTRKLVFSPADLRRLEETANPACRLLRQIVPPGIRASAGLFGVEGFHLLDVVGVVALARPTLLTTRQVHADVELRGELTRGMSVIDTRWDCPGKPNVELAVGLDVAAARKYVQGVLGVS